MFDTGTLLTLLAFVGTVSLALVLFSLFSGNPEGEERLDDLSRPLPPRVRPKGLSKIASATLPRMGAPLLPTDVGEQTLLQNRLIHAGFYKRNAVSVFLAVKMALLVLLTIAFGCAAVALLPGNTQAQISLMVVGGAVGLYLPNLWLDRRKTGRQNALRRGLPDALDVMVICLEGGLSVPEAIRRVSGELKTAHAVLASEMTIVQREILLGLSAGEALRKFAQRCVLEEVRSLAAVLLQSERFGASTVKALRTHAEVMRRKRQQRAEELAQQATVKVLFPTLLCIFPAVFIVFLGPAVFKIWATFSNIGK